MNNSDNPSRGAFSGFVQQFSLFKELITYVEIDEEAIREFIQFLHTTNGGAAIFAQLAHLNKMMGGMIDCLGQGFLSFKSDGVVSKICSRACIDLLETEPGQKKIWEVLRLTGEKKESFRSWMEIVFEGRVDFDSLAPLGLKRFSHSAGKVILLEYHAIRDKEGQISDLVLVATDHTQMELVTKQAELERQNVRMINEVVKQRKPFFSYVGQFRKQMNIFNSISEKKKLEAGVVQDFVRFLHTMKGGASIFAIDSIVTYIHALEEEWVSLSPLNEADGAKMEAYHKLIKKQTEGLRDQLESFLKKHRDILGDAITQAERTVELPISRIQKIQEKFVKLGVSKAALTQILELAKESVSTYLIPYTQLVSKLAQAQNKPLDSVEILNDDVSFFPEVYEDLINSFVHIFRNAIDHGVETTDERLKAKKPPKAKLSITVKKIKKDEKEWINFVFEDDGRGIDPKIIRARLASLKQYKNLEKLSDNEVIQKIFEPGFSTRDLITSFSGRGIGLDAVQNEAKKLGGTAFVETELGRGCRITVSVPDASHF